MYCALASVFGIIYSSFIALRRQSSQCERASKMPMFDVAENKANNDAKGDSKLFVVHIAHCSRNSIIVVVVSPAFRAHTWGSWHWFRPLFCLYQRAFCSVPSHIKWVASQRTVEWNGKARRHMSLSCLLLLWKKKLTSGDGWKGTRKTFHFIAMKKKIIKECRGKWKKIERSAEWRWRLIGSVYTRV